MQTATPVRYKLITILGTVYAQFKVLGILYITSNCFILQKMYFIQGGVFFFLPDKIIFKEMSAQTLMILRASLRDLGS